MKQETLEEAAEKYARKQCDDMYDNQGLTGASWGWETSLDFINWIDEKEIPREDGLWIMYFNGKDNYLTTKELFEQFKKK
jgi:hypothetical protein